MRISDWSSDVCSSDLARGCVPTHRVVFDKALWKLALQTRFVHGGCAQDQGILALMAKLDDHQPRFTEHGAVIEQPRAAAIGELVATRVAGVLVRDAIGIGMCEQITERLCGDRKSVV